METVLVEVYKTGEKVAGIPFNKRGRKPLGYNLYVNGSLYAFIPYKGIVWTTKEGTVYF